jgi:hypothetical protein
MNSRWRSWIALMALLAALLPAQIWPTSCRQPGTGGCCGQTEASEPCCGGGALQPAHCCSGPPPAPPASTPPLFVALHEVPAFWQGSPHFPGAASAAGVTGNRPPGGGILLQPLFTLHAAFLT